MADSDKLKLNTVNLLVNMPSIERELVALAIEWMRAERKIALVTLVNIEGNAPYPVGSQMLVNELGDFVGQITGGCAESAIADQAVVAITNAENQTQRYGLDSPYFDIQLPCGSGIDVYFDCQQSLDELLLIQHDLDARRASTFEIGGIAKTYLPTARLIVLGQGPILLELAQLAMAGGFEVVCVAQNEDTQNLLQRANLGCHKLDRAVELSAACDEYTAVVSLFHEHDLEIELLKNALKTDAFYIGALGSQKTHAARIDKLSEAGVGQSDLGRIYGPVGIDIGADTPGQIAISILAEMIGVMNRYGKA